MDKNVEKMEQDRRQSQEPPSLAWWRYGHVWLVIAGPAAVVLASIVTFWIALTMPDPVITDATSQRGGVVETRTNQPAAHAQAALAPAMQARNHLTVPAASAR